MSGWSMTVAKPISAISAGMRVSVSWKPSARAWLNPSAARKRWNEATSRWIRPVRRRVSSASSDSSSPSVSGTWAALLSATSCGGVPARA
jgi:hypothetical protein